MERHDDSRRTTSMGSLGDLVVDSRFLQLIVVALSMGLARLARH